MPEIDVNRISAMLSSARVDLDDAIQAMQGAAARGLAAAAAPTGNVNCSCNTGCACRRAQQLADPNQ